MITPTTFTEKLLFTTFRIETSLATGGNGTGTGFLFHFKIDETRFLPVIITNKHVVEGAIRGRFQLHEAQDVDGQRAPTGRFFPVDLPNFEQAWIAHPDPQIDLCALLFEPIRAQARQIGKDVFTVCFDDSILPSQDLLDGLTAV